jgi:hypothetical protein
MRVWLERGVEGVFGCGGGVISTTSSLANGAMRLQSV